MSFDEGDTVQLHDEHSEYDGETGIVDQVMDTMFGDATYTVSFEDGQETGVPADALEVAADEDDEAADDEDVDSDA
jgi:hypothetical protein